jgi:PPOX class probable F420-dependent enzyme
VHDERLAQARGTMAHRSSERILGMTSWTPGWDAFPPDLHDFWTERHLCTLATVRPDGRPHAVPVGVVLDHEERCAWVIANRNSHKVRRISAGPDAGVPVAACQVDGKRWSTLEGHALVLTDARAVRRAEDRYAERYRVPGPNPMRVAIRIQVDRFLMSRTLST